MNTTHPTSWKWSSGEPSEKSRRHRPEEDNMQQPIVFNEMYGNGGDNRGGGEDRTYKRDNCNSIFMERSMMTPFGRNPYIQSNYVDDLVIQDTFLKPQNSSYIHETK